MMTYWSCVVVLGGGLRATSTADIVILVVKWMRGSVGVLGLFGDLVSNA